MACKGGVHDILLISLSSKHLISVGLTVCVMCACVRVCVCVCVCGGGGGGGGGGGACVYNSIVREPGVDAGLTLATSFKTHLLPSSHYRH